MHTPDDRMRAAELLDKVLKSYRRPLLRDSKHSELVTAIADALAAERARVEQRYFSEILPDNLPIYHTDTGDELPDDRHSLIRDDDSTPDIPLAVGMYRDQYQRNVPLCFDCASKMISEQLVAFVGVETNDARCCATYMHT
jgi:hypothetical protein